MTMLPFKQIIRTLHTWSSFGLLIYSILEILLYLYTEESVWQILWGAASLKSLELQKFLATPLSCITKVKWMVRGHTYIM